MVIECPKCKKKYRVRDEDIPVGGAPVRCPACSNVFTIYREPLNIHLEPVEEPAPKPTVTQQPAFTAEPSPFVKPSAPPTPPPQPPPKPAGITGEDLLAGVEKTPQAAVPEAGIGAPEGIGTPHVPPSPPPTPPPPPSTQQSSPGSATSDAAARLKAALGLGGADEFPADWPEEKKQKHRTAKRLARSLAKDLLLYHRDKVEKGLREGTLKQLLGEELKKSWEFYKNSVDPEVLKTTNYFKDALNEIIGKGRKIFI